MYFAMKLLIQLIAARLKLPEKRKRVLTKFQMITLQLCQSMLLWAVWSFTKSKKLHWTWRQHETAFAAYLWITSLRYDAVVLNKLTQLIFLHLRKVFSKVHLSCKA